MAEGKPDTAASRRSRDDHPGPRRKGRAALAIAVILVVTIVVIFVARNLEHAKELENSPAPPPSPTAGQNG